MGDAGLQGLFMKHLRDIPGYDSFVKTEPVNKGLSHVKKYYIETADNRRLLLRVSDIKAYDSAKAEYERIQRMNTADLPMPRPVGYNNVVGATTHLR
jgi:serine/threonine-protein kinase